MSTLTYPDMTDGDNVINYVNGLKAVLLGGLNSVDGANLIADSVPIGAVAQGKMLSVPHMYYQGNLQADFGTGPTDHIRGFELPPLDGGAVSYSWKGASVHFQTLTKFNGAELRIRKIPAGGGPEVTIQTIDLFDATLATNRPKFFSVTPVALIDGDLIFMTYAGGGGVYTGLTLIPALTLNHVGT